MTLSIESTMNPDVPTRQVDGRSLYTVSNRKTHFILAMIELIRPFHWISLHIYTNVIYAKVVCVS